jgi:hypothetical protein
LRSVGKHWDRLFQDLAQRREILGDARPIVGGVALIVDLSQSAAAHCSNSRRHRGHARLCALGFVTDGEELVVKPGVAGFI